MFANRGLVNQSISIQQNTVQLSRWIGRRVHVVCYFLLKKFVVGIIFLSYAIRNSRNSQKTITVATWMVENRWIKDKCGEMTFQGRPFSFFEE